MTFRLPYVTPPKKQIFASDASQATNTKLLTNPIPFSNLPSNFVRDLPGLPPQQQPYNNLLYAVVVSQVPFRQDLSSSKVAPDWLPPVQYPNIVLRQPAPNPVPFNNIDWGRSRVNPVATFDSFNMVILDNSPPAQSPFYTQDWPTGKFPRAKQDRIYPNLVLYNPVVASPFRPQDWGKAYSVRHTSTDNLPNIVLNNPVLLSPFYSQDWSKTQRLPSVPPLTNMGSNVNLNSNPIPLNQIDWSKPYRIVPIASDQNNLPNLLLIQPSKPSTPLGIYYWTDWGKTKAPVIIVPDQDNLPNIVLIQTPPPPPEILVPSGRWLKDYERLVTDREIKQAAAVMSKVGGHARASSLTATQRSNIASKAAQTRWK